MILSVDKCGAACASISGCGLKRLNFCTAPLACTVHLCTGTFQCQPDPKIHLCHHLVQVDMKNNIGEVSGHSHFYLWCTDMLQSRVIAKRQVSQAGWKN
mmetsp:Transcript_7402/g.14116  ORF Transcript_7402/g.14116 Transcript_7402/m.14116 type:complete len:99 (+) Transcript_7402:211-507(+)